LDLQNDLAARKLTNVFAISTNDIFFSMSKCRKERIKNVMKVALLGQYLRWEIGLPYKASLWGPIAITLTDVSKRPKL